MLRGILIEAAWAAIKKDPSLADAFNRIAARAKGKRAIVAIARKLAGRARALIKSKEEYKCDLKTAA